MSSPLVYRIDAQDRLVAFNETWSEFARRNDGEALLPAHVQDRTLWDFLSDITIRDLYRRIVMIARGGRTVRFRYRCDSPRHRRVFAMQVDSPDAKTVEFSSTLQSEEERPACALLDPRHPRTRRLVRICSWCHGVSWPGELWVPLELAVERIQMLDPHRVPRVTHGICDPCAEKMLTTIARS